MMNEPKKNFKIVTETKARVILPNTLTLIGVCIGLSSIKFALGGKFELAIIAVIVAGIIDGLDGRIARLIKGTSKVGKELDSLTDVISFGVAPSFIMYFWAINEIGKLLKTLANLQHNNTISQTVHEILMNVTDLYQNLTRDDLHETKKKRKILSELQHLASDFETQNKDGKLSEFIQYLQLVRNFDVEFEEGFENKNLNFENFRGSEFERAYSLPCRGNKISDSQENPSD